MLHQTKKIKSFVLEIYELTHWWYNTNGYCIVFDYNSQSFKKINEEHWSIRPDCYKKIFFDRYSSEKKLNLALRELGYKKRRYGSYFFEPNIEKTICGYFGSKGQALSAPKTIVVVRQAHDLEATYKFRG